MKLLRQSQVNGVVQVPVSKSMAQRAIAAATLVSGSSTITVKNTCDDIDAAINAALDMGAQVKLKNGVIKITSNRSNNQIKKRIINCGESGLCFRMFCAVSSLDYCQNKLMATGNMLKRPVDMVIKPIAKMGGKCFSNDGFPPVNIQGPITGGEIVIDAKTSSQFLTGLLLSLPFCQNDSVIYCPGLTSKPYVKMTLKFLRKIGFKIIVSKNMEQFNIPGNQKNTGFKYVVPGDWSSAAFFIVAGAIAGKVTLLGLDQNSQQADKKIIDVIKLAGANICIEENKVTVKKAPLKSFEFDATHCPDLFAPLVALAAKCNGISKITGVHRLKTKESNREKTLIKEFRTLGVFIESKENSLFVKGKSSHDGSLKKLKEKMHEKRIHSHGDHRIAMATAIAALTINGDIKITEEQSVSKSYPDFFKDLKSIGADVS